MTDTPGWASPGSDPTPEGREPGASDTAGQPGNGSGAPAPQPGPQPQGPGAQWSGQQPPPGQWSTPTGAPGQAPPPGPGWGGPRPGTPGGGYGGPPGHGAPGYGAPHGYGAWGGGWGGPPPAAKPGVIPLRPLGVGEILDGAVSTLRTYWRTVLGISLALAVVTEVIAVLVQGYFLNRTVERTSLGDPTMPPAEALRVMGESFLSSIILGLITLIGTLIATAMLTSVTSRAVLGRPATLGEAWREARPQLLRLFGQMLLLGLLGLGIMLVASVPGVIGFLAGSRVAGVALLVLGFGAGMVVLMWLTVRFSLAAPALMLEKQGIMHSLRRSAKLVNGSWWRILGIQLLAGLIVAVVRVVISIPFTVIALITSDDGLSSLLGQNGGHLSWTFLVIVGIGAMIGTTITLPISACVTVFLYIDQRIRREGLDLELARAAGVQGTPAPAGAPGPVPGS
ncbi:DUF7847 domain-containing protein [Streptomyces murinus]|uniref:DUF7847 domain-containing protein n=1 Tax=Streptomyces murinus TaxID=33900 RepID=UPI003F450FAD